MRVLEASELESVCAGCIGGIAGSILASAGLAVVTTVADSFFKSVFGVRA